MQNKFNKESIIVSACLLGINCKYNGGNNHNPQMDRVLKQYHVIPVCPEQLGGLRTPRPPAEIKNNKVVRQNGEDVTAYFEKGAQETLGIAILFSVKTAILKDKSPSCGKNFIYNGNFEEQLIKGEGITTSLLLENNIRIVSENELCKIS